MHHLRLYIVVLLAALLCLWKLGTHNIQEWDEARNGVTAFEMCQNHDYINYSYHHQPDTWSAKPPLFIYMVVLSYRAFGFNEFALRFPAVICILLFFIVFYKLVKRYAGNNIAFVTCMVLLASPAIIANHIGITGDFDAPLILFLTLAAYYFLQYTEDGRKRAIYLCAISLGLAFYAKGTAALLFVPGFALYLLLAGKVKETFREKHVYLSALLFVIISGSWIALVLIFGKTTEHSFYGSKNPVETMLVYDAFKRMTSKAFGEYVPQHYFFFTTLDICLNLWNYLFYLSIATCIFVCYKNRGHLRTLLQNSANRLMLFSGCVVLPMALLMTFATSKHEWYLAPFFGFIVFITVRGCWYISSRWRPFSVVWIGLLLFTFIRQCLYIYNLPTDTHTFYSRQNELFKDAPYITTTIEPTQDMLLYMEWMNLDIIAVYNAKQMAAYKGRLIISGNNNMTGITPIRKFENLGIGRIE